MSDLLSAVSLPWFWVFASLLAAWGIGSALKRNHRSDFTAMQSLVAAGVDLEKPRKVQFALFVPTPASAAFLRERLLQEGYEVTAESADVELQAPKGRSTEKRSGHLVRASKVVVLYGGTLRTARQAFSSLAAKENGLYLGWEVLDRSPLGEAQL